MKCAASFFLLAVWGLILAGCVSEPAVQEPHQFGHIDPPGKHHKSHATSTEVTTEPIP